MIDKSTLVFLKKLSENNNREWFLENKKIYEVAKENFINTAQEILTELAEHFEDLRNTDIKKCIFRINRDVRFSKDKSPYKTHLSAAFGEGGKSSGKIDIYFQLEPENKTMIGGGIWQPQPAELAAFRQEIDYAPESLLKIINSKEFKSNFPNIYGERLKNTPKGYPSDHPNAELLKYKEMFFYTHFSDLDVCSSSFVKEFIKKALILKPFLDYSNEILGK